MSTYKMSRILEEQNLIFILNTLVSTLIILKDQSNFLYTKGQYPNTVLSQLETLIYSSKRLEIDCLTNFINTLSKKFGQEFIENAYNNTMGHVNVLVVQKFINSFDSKYLFLQLRKFSKDNNIYCNFDQFHLDDNVLDDANINFNR